MIQAQDLRIGNKIRLPLIGNEEIEVVGIPLAEANEQFIQAKTKSGSIFFEKPEKYKPIPLTEDWLLKAGWIWNKDSVTYEKYPNGDSRMHLTYDSVFSGYTMFNYVIKALIANKIQYVHQLQNIYFDLTGEELTFKM